MFQDLRYGLRLMIRRPGFSAIAVATLALGIGTTTAIFSVADRVLLRPVPYPDPERLAVIWETSPTIPLPVMFASPPNLHEWQQRSRSFEAMGGFQWRNVTLGGTEPEQIRAARVTAGFLPALGVQPRLGRLFMAEEDRANGRPVIIISDALWRRRFEASPNILGRIVPIDGVPSEIIGVMPRGYVSPPPVVLRGNPPSEPTDLWVPHGIDLETGQRGAHYLGVIGRLEPAVSLDAANREMNAIQEQIERDHPDYREWRALVVPLVEQVTSSSRRAVGLLVSAVLFVLLLSCANVANLLLARGVGRRREFAVRTALGAGRLRLATQVISEAMTLSIAGGVAGLVLAAALVRVMVVLGPAAMPGLRETRIDGRTAAFAIAASLLSAMLAGALPALGVIRARLSAWLADRSGGSGPGVVRAQRALAVGQVGLAVALLVTAALLVDSFRQLRAVDPGFRAADLITAKVTLPAARYPQPADRTRFLDRVVERVSQVAGVTAVATIDAVPMADNRQGTGFARLDGPPADPTGSPTANVAWISEGYFEAMGIPLVAGRTFTVRDAAGSPPVLIINRRLARQVFGDQDPVGRQARSGNAGDRTFEIVGVVGDEHHVGIDTEATPSFFLAYRQIPAGRDLAVVMRAEASRRDSAVAGLRTAIKQIDPDLALAQVRSMVQVVDASVATPRSMAWLLSAFAAAALMLAAIGVFGVMSHAVSQRTREIGLRMAVGASPHQMLRAILAEGLAQVGLGLVAGIILSALTSRLLSGLLFGVTALSLAPYVIVTVVLAAASLAACVVPARRAMRVDPALALRSE